MADYPKTTQAITIARHGGVDVLEKTEVPVVVQPDHIVVRVEYLGVNFIDIYHRSGLYPLKQLPATLGTEAAGVVLALPTDPAVLADPDYQARAFRVGDTVAVLGPGAFAATLSVPWGTAYPLPHAVSTRTAAAALLQGLTALTLAHEAHAVRRGVDAVFVHALAGGLGLLLAQVARRVCGARALLGTTGTQAKADAARRVLGAGCPVDALIVHREEGDVPGKVLEFTGGEGVDVVYDGVGKATFEGDFRMLKRKGTLVCVGNASGAIPPFDVLKLSEKNIKLVRPTATNYLYTPAERLHYGNMLFDLLARGELNVSVYREYPFSAAGVAQAQTDLADGITVGKLVIKVAEDKAAEGA